MSEKPTSAYDGVFSGLVAAGEITRLLDKFCDDPQRALVHEDRVRTAEAASNNANRVPGLFDKRSQRGDFDPH